MNVTIKRRGSVWNWKRSWRVWGTGRVEMMPVWPTHLPKERCREKISPDWALGTREDHATGLSRDHIVPIKFWRPTNVKNIREKELEQLNEDVGTYRRFRSCGGRAWRRTCRRWRRWTWPERAGGRCWWAPASRRRARRAASWCPSPTWRVAARDRRGRRARRAAASEKPCTRARTRPEPDLNHRYTHTCLLCSEGLCIQLWCIKLWVLGGASAATWIVGGGASRNQWWVATAATRLAGMTLKCLRQTDLDPDRADFARQTHWRQWRVLSDLHGTPTATTVGVLLFFHGSGICFRLNCDNVNLLNNLETDFFGYWTMMLYDFCYVVPFRNTLTGTYILAYLVLLKMIIMAASIAVSVTKVLMSLRLSVPSF